VLIIESRSKINLSESSDLDTYLAIFKPNNLLLKEQDDISSKNSNSIITVTLSETRNYRIIANSYAANRIGAYTLTVQ
jgi:hypothetical protein